MSESFYDTIVILFYTVVPLILILLQVFFSTRRKRIWGFIIPVLWTTMGIWMALRNKEAGSIFTLEMILFFLAGDVILFGIMAFVRYLKNKK